MLISDAEIRCVPIAEHLPLIDKALLCDGSSKQLCIQKDRQHKECNDKACRKLYQEAFH